LPDIKFETYDYTVIQEFDLQ